MGGMERRLGGGAPCIIAAALHDHRRTYPSAHPPVRCPRGRAGRGPRHAARPRRDADQQQRRLPARHGAGGPGLRLRHSGRAGSPPDLRRHAAVEGGQRCRRVGGGAPPGQDSRLHVGAPGGARRHRGDGALRPRPGTARHQARRELPELRTDGRARKAGLRDGHTPRPPHNLPPGHLPVPQRPPPVRAPPRLRRHRDGLPGAEDGARAHGPPVAHRHPHGDTQALQRLRRRVGAALPALVHLQRAQARLRVGASRTSCCSRPTGRSRRPARRWTTCAASTASPGSTTCQRWTARSSRPSSSATRSPFSDWRNPPKCSSR